MSKDIDGNGM